MNLLITSRVVDHFRGVHHRRLKKHDADLELGSYGIANLVGGTFGAPLSVGIPARSLANVQCGCTTRVSNLLHACFLVVLLTFGGRPVAQIPLAALAGVTAWVGARLLDWSTWRRLPKMRHADAAAFVITAAAVLSVNAVAAVAIGCSMYVLRSLYHRPFPTPWPPRLSIVRTSEEVVHRRRGAKGLFALAKPLNRRGGGPPDRVCKQVSRTSQVL